MKERASDKWLSATLSVVVHGTLVALLVWGFWFYKPAPTPAPRLAIEATVVDPKSLPADALKPAARPAPTPPKPVPPPPEPPPPQPDTAKIEQEKKAEQERVDKQRQEKERVEKERVETERIDQQRVEKERAEAAAAAAATAAAARDKAEKERVEKDKADQVAKQKAADERLQAQRQSELRAQMAAEERAMAARNSTQMQQYLALIQAKIESNWNRPGSARPGLACEVHITQVPGGEVTNVRVGSCNGDAAVKESIENAVNKASPLPQPSDAALFDRNLIVTFRPEE